MVETDSLDVSNVIRSSMGTVVDSDTLLRKTQTRIWASLRGEYQYVGLSDDSDKFLRRNVFKKFNFVVLYVDLVGSTEMALSLSDDKMAVIMSSFAQEMASTIVAHHGLVLKFMGDAVIGYFVATENSLLAADRAVRCAKSMMLIIEQGINPILTQYDYPELQVKIGIDYGTNMVVRYGQDSVKSHVDLMGRSMNMASKIQSMAGPNQILLGEDVYQRLHPDVQDELEPVVWENRIWMYQGKDGSLYGVYSYRGTSDDDTDDI